jgi:hypothetical protein
LLGPTHAAESPPSPYAPGYFQRLSIRSRDVYKLVLLSLMVTLGISLHWFVTHYVTTWLEDSDLTERQGLLVRLLYPAVVLFVLWNVKAFQ